MFTVVREEKLYSRRGKKKETNKKVQNVPHSTHKWNGSWVHFVLWLWWTLSVVIVVVWPGGACHIFALMWWFNIWKWIILLASIPYCSHPIREIGGIYQNNLINVTNFSFHNIEG